MPKKDELNKLLVLPNTEHVEITGIFEELPAAVAWVLNKFCVLKDYTGNFEFFMMTL